MDDFPIPISEGLSITFNHADTDYLPRNTDEIITWLKTIIEAENGKVAELNYIFCTDAYLHKLNVEYLEHDSLTDIITFPINSDPIQSDIFISIDRVRENALDRNLTEEVELYRVVVHGLLHLLGYVDKSKEEKQTMRSKENTYLHNFGKY